MGNRFLHTILFLVIALIAYSQNTIIEGTILDANDTPLIGVNIAIVELSEGTQSVEDGTFKIVEIPEGDYVLRLSYIGYKTKELPISIKNNEASNFGSITMYEWNELLQDITITATRDNKFSRKNTAYVSKLPLRDMDNSTVYSTITTELLESQVVTNFDDAIVNATGISKLWEATGRDPGQGTGYFATRGFSIQPALVNGMPGFTFSSIDPSYIERIEVIKGPSATLFGSTVSSLGGLINVVTKKPYRGTGGSVSYTAGSYNMHRITGDINTPIGNSDNLYFRLNTSYLTQDSWQDAGFRKTFFMAPSLSYKASSKLNFSLGVEYSRTEQTNPTMLFIRRGFEMISNNVDELGVNPNKSFTSNDVALTSPIINTRLVTDYKITDNWSSQTVIASTNSKAEGYYQYLFEGAPIAFSSLAALQGVPGIEEILVDANSLLAAEGFTRVFDKRDGKGAKYNIQQNFTGDINIGNMRNRLLIGLDYVHRSRETNTKSGNPVITSTPAFANLIQNLTGLESLGLVPENTAAGLAYQLSSLPYLDGIFKADGTLLPNVFTPEATYTPSIDKLDAVFDQIPVKKIQTASSTFAAYVSDVVNVTDNLTLNVGLRLDHFDQDGDKNSSLDDFTKTTISPTAGVLYQPIDNQLTLFANYQTGFINNNPVINQDGTVQNFEPMTADQIEAGVKTNFFDGKLNAGLSYYYISVEDVLYSDPHVPLFPTSISIAEMVSQGIEFEINSNPLNGLNLRASFAYNDKLTTDAYSETTDQVYVELQDRRSEDAGPDNIYNLWVDYRFSSSENEIIKNIGIGAGFNGATEHNVINNGVAGQFTLPAYTIYNAALYYNTDKFRIGLKVNNLSDVVYYKGWGTVNPQPPRAIIATASYKF